MSLLVLSYDVCSPRHRKWLQTNQANVLILVGCGVFCWGDTGDKVSTIYSTYLEFGKNSRIPEFQNSSFTRSLNVLLYVSLITGVSESLQHCTKMCRANCADHSVYGAQIGLQSVLLIIL